MRNLARALLASGLGFAVSLIIAACGGGAGLLSGDQANSLNNQLTRISAALQQGHCAQAQAAANGLVEKVGSLPATVESRLREDLDLGASTVSQLAARQCHPSTTQTSTTAPTTSTTTAPATTSTAPATTTAPPPAHTTTTPTTTTPAPPPTTTGPASGGGGLGGGTPAGPGGGPGAGAGAGSKHTGATHDTGAAGSTSHG